MVEDLAEGDTKVDTRLAGWLHEHASPGWTTFFDTVTRLGNVSTLLVVVLVAGVFLWRKRWIAELQLLVLATVGAEIITIGLKLGFQRDRPFFADPLASESSHSFPSGTPPFRWPSTELWASSLHAISGLAGRRSPP